MRLDASLAEPIFLKDISARAGDMILTGVLTLNCAAHQQPDYANHFFRGSIQTAGGTGTYSRTCEDEQLVETAGPTKPGIFFLKQKQLRSTRFWPDDANGVHSEWCCGAGRCRGPGWMGTEHASAPCRPVPPPSASAQGRQSRSQSWR